MKDEETGTKQNARSPTELLHLVLKQMFGVSDHVIQRIIHTISNAGELVEVQRRIRDIPAPIITQIVKNINNIDESDLEMNIGDDVAIPTDNINPKDRTSSNPLESRQSFKKFLITEFDASNIQATRLQVAGQGLSTKAERRIAGNLSDQEFIKKQAQEREDLTNSEDPIDKRILQLKKQLDILYKQKAAKARQQLPR